MAHCNVAQGYILVVLFFALFGPTAGHQTRGHNHATEHQQHIAHSPAELEDIVLVIQSQRNSFHAQRGQQRRREILQQAAELRQGFPFVILLHELSDYEGDWSILPALPLSASWFLFIEEETRVSLAALLQVLSRYEATKEWFLGKRIHDVEASIIHHYAFSEDPGSFGYPDPAAGWALSTALLQR